MTRAASGPPRRHRDDPGLLERTVLDEQVRTAKQRDPRPWGVWPWLAPLITLAALIAVGQLISRHLDLHGPAATLAVGVSAIAGDAVLAVVAVTVAWRAVRRSGGWGPAVGWVRPRLGDLAAWGIGFGFALAGRLVVGILATGLAGPSATRQAQNLRIGSPDTASVVVLALAVVVVAPAVEELVFRGLLLRTFARRMRFWPAALLSTVLFAAFHVYEVRTVVGAVILAAGVGVLGLVNCYLVRITGRLTPGMLTHATSNLLAFGVLLAMA